MTALRDEPNSYATTPLASAPRPIPPSYQSRLPPDPASAFPSSSAGSQVPNWTSMPGTSGPPEVNGFSNPPYSPSPPAVSTSNDAHAKTSSHVSRKSHKSRSQDPESRTERRDRRGGTTNSSSQRSKGVTDTGAVPYGYPTGPVRGRPLIFAAMASTEDESIVPFLPEDLPQEEPQQVVYQKPSEVQYEGEPSREYPSPRSPSPPLPKAKEVDRLRSSSETSQNSDHDRTKMQQSPLLLPRMRTQSLPGEQFRVQKDPEDAHRSRKLSGSNLENRPTGQHGSRHTTAQMIDEVPIQAAQASTDDTSSFAQPQQASLVQEETSVLGSPIHLGRTLSESRSADAVSPPRSRGTHRERERNREKDRDLRSRRLSRDGIKLLTERQMERLNARIASANASANPQGQGHRKREEEAGLRSPRAIKAVPPVEPPTPVSPEDLPKARSKRRGHRSERSILRYSIPQMSLSQRQSPVARACSAPLNNPRRPSWMCQS